MTVFILLASTIFIIAGAIFLKNSYALLINKNYTVQALANIDEKQKSHVASYYGFKLLAQGIWFIFAALTAFLMQLPVQTWLLIMVVSGAIETISQLVIRRRLGNDSGFNESELKTLSPWEWGLLIALGVVMPLLITMLAGDAIFLAFGVLGTLAVLLMVARRGKNES